MQPVLHAIDCAVIALIATTVVVIASAVRSGRTSDQLRVDNLERKLDLLMSQLNRLPAAGSGPASGQSSIAGRLQDGLSDEVRRLADANQKIEAIKLLREQTGLDLKEAKDAVDAYQSRR